MMKNSNDYIFMQVQCPYIVSHTNKLLIDFVLEHDFRSPYFDIYFTDLSLVSSCEKVIVTKLKEN